MSDHFIRLMRFAIYFRHMQQKILVAYILDNLLRYNVPSYHGYSGLITGVDPSFPVGGAPTYDFAIFQKLYEI